MILHRRLGLVPQAQHSAVTQYSCTKISKLAILVILTGSTNHSPKNEPEMICLSLLGRCSLFPTQIKRGESWGVMSGHPSRE